MSRTILTRLQIQRFKLFDDVDIELGERVVLIGPNNAGKTSALQALALWDLGVKRWLEKRGGGKVPKKRPGVTINRRDLIALPVPAANLLWRDLRVRHGSREGGKTRTRNITVELMVEGIFKDHAWQCGLEFDYANEESFYCRPLVMGNGDRMEVPEHLTDLKLAFLPPMSGLAANETRLDEGAVNVRIGEGRTSEVLRNLCYRVFDESEGKDAWGPLCDKIEALFGCRLDEPQYVAERGEITMTYKTADNIQLDLSCTGGGMQQTLLLLAHMAANPGTVLLLDEPDAHLEILRQRQIYQVVTKTAEESGGQVLMASHSEVILNEAADRDTVIAFVGAPHRIDNRGSQVKKALKEIGFEHYYQAEERGWVLYLEGSTDLAILRAFAERLGHPAVVALESPFVYYVGNQPTKSHDHFHGLREAKPDLRGIAVYDRLEREPPHQPELHQHCWARNEIENYLCQKQTLLAYAEDLGRSAGELFATSYRETMEDCVQKLEGALKELGKESPWGSEIKASDDFLTPLFNNFFEELKLPNLIDKTDFHVLVPHVPKNAIDPEITTVLDEILRVSTEKQ